MTDIMIRWSLGIHSEISPKKFQVFVDLLVMIRWSPGVSTIFDLSKSVYLTSMDLRRDGKRSLKFREMLETQDADLCADWSIPWSG